MDKLHRLHVTVAKKEDRGVIRSPGAELVVSAIHFLNGHNFASFEKVGIVESLQDADRLSFRVCGQGAGWLTEIAPNEGTALCTPSVQSVGAMGNSTSQQGCSSSMVGEGSDFPERALRHPFHVICAVCAERHRWRGLGDLSSRER